MFNYSVYGSLHQHIYFFASGLILICDELNSSQNHFLSFFQSLHLILPSLQARSLIKSALSFETFVCGAVICLPLHSLSVVLLHCFLHREGKEKSQ